MNNYYTWTLVTYIILVYPERYYTRFSYKGWRLTRASERRTSVRTMTVRLIAISGNVRFFGTWHRLPRSGWIVRRVSSRVVASRRLASRRRRGRPRDERDWRDAIDVHAWHTLVARNSIALRCYASRRRQVRPWPADGRIDIRAKRQVVLHGMFARRPRFRRRDEYYDVEVTRRNNV